MELIEIIILGLVQAITEWLPLSSKTMDAFVYLQVFGNGSAGLVPVLLALHAGTLAAALIYFRKEIAAIISKAKETFTSLEKGKGPLSSIGNAKDGPIGFYASAILFTGIVGIPLLAIEMIILPNLDAGLLFSIMGAGLIATGFLLSTSHKHEERKHESTGWQDGIFTGALQGLSVLPGVSRAGTTTTALIWRGFDSESAFHLSFLLSIPTVFIAEILLWLGQGFELAIPMAELAALALSSFIFGYLTIDILIKFARRINVASLAFIFGIVMLLFGIIGIS